MIISWYGEGCFKLQSGDLVVLTDPPPKDSGISAPRTKADILIRTIMPWPNNQEENNSGATIFGAGEYDIKGIKIRGHQISSESSKNFFKTIYTLSWDDITIGLLGTIEKEPDPKLMDGFEEIDVIIGPGGGAPFINQEGVVKLVKKLNPKIFIPSFFKIPGLKRKADSSKTVIDLFGNGVEKNQEKFVFKKKDIVDIKKTTMICLKP